MAYMSPERIDGAKYSFPSDIWSFGKKQLEKYGSSGRLKHFSY